MTTFLLDQNVNRKSLAENCNKEGKAQVWRFPRKWAEVPGGFKDPDLLPVVMAGDKPLVTNDREIARQNARLIPPTNPGIVIVGFSKGTIKPLGKGDVEKILLSFKNQFALWHQVPWANSIVEITQNSVEVWHVEGGMLRQDGHLPMSQPGWPRSLEVILKANANATPTPGASQIVQSPPETPLLTAPPAIHPTPTDDPSPPSPPPPPQA